MRPASGCPIPCTPMAQLQAEPASLTLFHDLLGLLSGMRKALQTEQGKAELEARVRQLERENKELERQVGGREGVWGIEEGRELLVGLCNATVLHISSCLPGHARDWVLGSNLRDLPAPFGAANKITNQLVLGR